MNRDLDIIWEPSAKQAEFLSAPEDEVLYGGAAGGGKSDALLIDALGLNQSPPAIANPRYRALLIRRSFPEVRDLVNRSRMVYPRVCEGAKFREADHEWEFPGGGRIEFNYTESETDVFRFQGREFQWIGVDELTHHPTPAPWHFLRSRLRSPDPNLKKYMRAGTNPGGPGHQWVQEYWQIDAAGSPTSFRAEVKDPRTGATSHFTRRFIPAKLEDNPHLADSGYREALLSLPDMQRRAWLDGRWDVVQVEGAIYKLELERAYEEKRIRNVPYDPLIPVDTYWDLGVGDATAIWFRQDVGQEIRVVDYFEASGEGLPYYANELQRRHYNYGRHYAPPDIRVRELGSGLSRIDTAKKLGLRFEIVPTMRLEDGIHSARMMFPRCYFDMVKCKAGLQALSNYRWDKNKRLGELKSTPVHDWSSHGADAFRYMAVAKTKPQAGGEAPRRRVPAFISGSLGWMA
jgi:hypothetical protein